MFRMATIFNNSSFLFQSISIKKQTDSTFSWQLHEKLNETVYLPLNGRIWESYQSQPKISFK